MKLKQEILEMLDDYGSDLNYLQDIEIKNQDKEGVKWYLEQQDRVVDLIKRIKKEMK